ncbi:DUF2334 domain-containing protein [uncultured Corynebacterium sp.]|uniref:DUF2334 domain-containing protein n=1 Tax=uncultured Corynebacterium sp. TaxID=159447 RepID=UPI002592E7A5|nr:DUF2334 domain-containing protein [uncultured Corynebacterium sp.]
MMNPAESPQLLLTITGIRRETVVGAEAMRDALRGIGANAGLVVTAQAPEWKLQADSAALEFIHESVAQKHELLLGGMGLSRVGTSETKGEFHRLGHHEAQLRLTASRRQLSALGLEPEVFAPDKWMASEETMRAARQQGLLAAADAYGIRDLHSGERHNVRVLAFGDGFGAARWWRRNVSASVDRMAQRGADVRLSINAGKADRENTKSDLLRIVEELLDRGYQSQHYSKYVSRQRLAVA